MRIIHTSIALALAAFGFAGFTPDRTHTWTATPSTYTQSGAVLSDGDLVAIGSERHTSITRVDADQGPLWTVAITVPTADYVVAPDDSIYVVLASDVLTKISPNGQRVWTKTLGEFYVDMAFSDGGLLLLSRSKNETAASRHISASHGGGWAIGSGYCAV